MFCLLCGQNFHSQTVSFTTNPTFNSGVVPVICSGSTITFTNTSTGFPSGSSYSWFFSGASPSSATGSGPQSVTFNNPGFQTAGLTVNGQSHSIQINVVSGPTPNLALGSGANFTNGLFNNQPYFLACDGSPASFLSLSSNSSQTDANSTHTISWGNGQPDFVFTGENFLFHPVTMNSSTFYEPGEYTLTYTVDNGVCLSMLTQAVFSGTPPGGSIENSMQTQSFCIPGNVMYNINTQANGPGTLYEIVFNDGSNSTYSFQHPPPSFIAHEFPSNSCGATSTFDGTTYFNSFSVTMNTINACGQATSGIAPIIISEIPEADFEMSDTVVCVNTSVFFYNSSENGTNVTGGINLSTAGCDTLADVIWTHTPLANVDLLDGDLGTVFTTPIGSQWFPGTELIELSFSEPGTYAISLMVRNKPQCGVDTITKTICVLPELFADFTLVDSSACAPYTFNPQNLSNSVDCENANVFEWTVTRSNPENCPYGGNPGYQFINGTDENSFEPDIHFTSPGVYQIQLINSLEVEVPGVLCQGDTVVKTLLIKDIPFISLDSMAICEGSSYTLEPVQSDCYADNGLVYDWNFAPSSASISSSDLSNPTVSYASMGLFTYSVTVTNECGQLSQSAPIFVEEGISVQASGPLTDCISSPMPLIGVISGGVTTGTWSSDLPSGVFTPSPTSSNPYFSFPDGFTGDVTFILSSDSSANGCPPALAELTVNINSTIFANAGAYPPLCINTPLELTGAFGGLASSVTWSSLNGGTFDDITNPTTTYHPPLDFIGDVTLILTTDNPPGDCEADADTIVITVVPLPIIEAFSDTTICEGQSVNIFASGGSIYDWNPGLGTGSSHIVAPILPTVYTVVGTDSLGCSSTDSIYVHVLPAPDINILDDLLYCPSDQTSEITFTSSFSNAIFLWSRTTESIGLNDFSGEGNIPSFTTVNSTNDLLTATFTVTPEAENCPGQSVTFDLTVNPTPQIVNDTSQVICPGSSEDVIWESNLDSNLLVNYSWELVASGPNLSGAIVSGQSELPSMTIINSGNETEELTYLITHHYDSCFGEPFFYSIIVNPGPVMDAISAQEICSGAAFENVTFSASVSGTTYSWELISLNIPANVMGYPNPTGSDSIIGTMVSNTTNEPINLIYEVTPNAIGCTGAPELFTLTVNPELTVSTSMPDQFVCNNNPSEEVILSSNAANTDVQWEVVDLPNVINGVSVLSGMNTIPSFSLSNANTSDIEHVVIAMVPLNSAPSLCPGDTVFYEIAVFPTPVVEPVSDSLFCNGDLTASIEFFGNATNYSWTHNGDSIGIDFVGNNTIDPFVILNSGLEQSDVFFTVTPQVIFNNEICEGIPTSFTLTINPSGQVNPLADIVVCVGDSVPEISFSTNLNDGVLQYDWFNSNTSIGLAGQGSGDFIPAFFAQNNGSIDNLSILQVVPSYQNSGLVCVGDTVQFEISINPIPQIVYIADTFICNTETLNVIPQTNIAADFLWIGEPNPFVNGISTATQLGSGINDELENTSPSAQVVHYSIAPVSPGTGCVGDTNYIEVIVEPYIFMTSPTVYEICSGTSVNSVLTSNVPVNYTWFGTPNNQVVGTTTFEVNSGVIQDTLFNLSATPQMVVYTVIPSTLSGNCQGVPLIINVLVNPELAITSPSAQTICNNEALNVQLTANANGTFSWFATSNGPVQGETTTVQNTSVINDQLFNSSNEIEQVVYNIVITSLDQGCTSQNFEMLVDVVPTPTLVQPNDITVCQGSTVDDLTISGTFTGLNWTNDNQNTGIASFASNVPNFAGFNAQNNNNFPISSNINITPIYEHNQASCFGSVQDFSVNVNPTGQVNFIPNVEVCHGTDILETQITTSNLTGTTTFTWSNDNLNTGLNLTSGTGNVPSFTSANSFSNDPIVSNITVIGSYVHNNVSCPSNPLEFQVIVNPIPMLNPIPNLSFCNGDQIPGYVFSGSGSNHFVWSHNNQAIGLPLNGSGNVPQFTANNSTFNNITSTIHVQSFYNSLISNLSCSGSSQDFTITIQPSPFVSFSTDASVYCSKNDVAFYNYSGPNLSFAWDFGDGNSAFVTNPFHEFQDAGTYNVTLTGTHNGTGCSGVYTSTLTILETPTVSFSVDSAMQCYPAVFTFTEDIQAPFTYSVWNFGDGQSVVQNDSVNHVYSDFGCYDVSLFVGSENGCADSLTIPNMVCYFPQPVAYFTTDNDEYNATNAVVSFFNESEFATSYIWSFGDGSFSTAINPVHVYPEEEMGYGILLTAFNQAGCSDTFGLYIQVIEDKLFYVPNAFTPENMDGVNDVFIPVVSSGYNRENYHLAIYNRWGELVFETRDIEQAWDGLAFDGRPCPDGAYVWQLTLRGIKDEDAEVFRGHINLLR